MGICEATTLQQEGICRTTTIGTGLRYTLERPAMQPLAVETANRLHSQGFIAPTHHRCVLRCRLQVLKTSRVVNDVQNSRFSSMGKYSCVNHRINEACRFTGAVQPGGHSVNSQTLPISSQISPLNNVCTGSVQAPVVFENSLKTPASIKALSSSDRNRSLVDRPDVYLYHLAR
jgi:hypothetical protein